MKTIKIVSYNIQFGKGQDDKVDIMRIASEVKGADIIALQEVDRFMTRSNCLDQKALLESCFSEYYSHYSPGLNFHLPASTPTQPKRRQFGNLILSRFPINSVLDHALPKAGSIDAISIQRTLTEATIALTNTLSIRLYNTHLCHLTPQTRLPQIETIMRINRDSRHKGPPLSGKLVNNYWDIGVDTHCIPEHSILLGDFNCVPDSEEYQRIVGPESIYGGRVCPSDGYLDAWAIHNPGMNTATSDVRKTPARLDYIFVSPSLSGYIEACYIDSSATGSDHLPVWLTLQTNAS